MGGMAPVYHSAFAPPAASLAGRRRPLALAMCKSQDDKAAGLSRKPVRPVPPEGSDGPEALASPPARPGASPDSSSPSPSPSTLPSAPSLPEIRKPPELQGMLTDSQERRLGPVRPVMRAGRTRQRRSATKAEEMDWDNMTKRRIVSPKGTYVNLKDVKQIEQKKSRMLEIPNELQPDVRDKLKKEVVQPYTQNWILVAIAVVGLLVVLYAVLPTETPIISIPDL